MQRAGGSLLHAAGLPDLVAPNAAEYVNSAVRLGTDSTFRESVRERLSEAIAGQGPAMLFRPEIGVRSIISGLRQAYLRWQRGEGPAHIDADEVVITMGDEAHSDLPPSSSHTLDLAPAPTVDPDVTGAVWEPEASQPLAATEPGRSQAAGSQPNAPVAGVDQVAHDLDTTVDLQELRGWWPESSFFGPLPQRTVELQGSSIGARGSVLGAQAAVSPLLSLQAAAHLDQSAPEAMQTKLPRQASSSSSSA
jgi:hypothetical protein